MTELEKLIIGVLLIFFSVLLMVLLFKRDRYYRGYRPRNKGG